MSYSKKKKKDSRDKAMTFLKQAFPLSPNLAVIIMVPSELVNENTIWPQEDPHPWSLMHNFQEDDVDTLLYHHFWLSKAISFSVFLANTFVTKWINNYHFFTNDTTDETHNQIISTIAVTLSDNTSAISKELHKLPQETISNIINSINIHPFN